jgi:protein TonB
MHFSNPIVISQKIYQKEFLANVKALLASAGVHGSVFAALIYFSPNEPRPIPMDGKPMMVSLANYVPSKSRSKTTSADVSTPKTEAAPLPPRPVKHKQVSRPAVQKPSPKKATKPLPVPTPPAIPSPSPAVLPEASSPQLSAVRSTVAPSALEPTIDDASEEDQKPIADSSPFSAPSSSATDSQKKDLSADEIDGSTLGRIRTMIENALTYPAIARKLRLEGTVIVSFMLETSGLVEKVEIITSSGSAMLDGKALQTVLALNGDYPTLPKTAFLKVPITFSLTGH